MRSIYSDAHTSTFSGLVRSHAAHLFVSGVTDREMHTKLSQRWHTSGTLAISYTRDYLAKHPIYTGANAHAMPSYEAAVRRQDERFEAMEKLVRD
jgi:hypothetical protein